MRSIVEVRIVRAPVECACVHACVCRECRSWNKGSILRCTVDYVRSLQTHQQTMFAMLTKNRQLEHRNQQLRNEVEVSSAASLLV